MAIDPPGLSRTAMCRPSYSIVNGLHVERREENSRWGNCWAIAGGAAPRAGVSSSVSYRVDCVDYEIGFGIRVIATLTIFDLSGFIVSNGNAESEIAMRHHPRREAVTRQPNRYGFQPRNS